MAAVHTWPKLLIQNRQSMNFFFSPTDIFLLGVLDFLIYLCALLVGFKQLRFSYKKYKNSSIVILVISITIILFPPIKCTSRFDPLTEKCHGILFYLRSEKVCPLNAATQWLLIRSTQR